MDAVLIAYIEHVLVPTLASGDIVIMDNLASHKVAGVRQAIEAAGARILYLPPYSPDLNPIEQASPNSKQCCACQGSANCRSTLERAQDISSHPKNALEVQYSLAYLRLRKLLQQATRRARRTPPTR